MGRVEGSGRSGGVARQGLVHGLGRQQVGQGVLMVAQAGQGVVQRRREGGRATAGQDLGGDDPGIVFGQGQPVRDGRRADDLLG